MKTFFTSFALFAFLLHSFNSNAQMYFVKDAANNADIFFMPSVDFPALTVQLTTHLAIDNHPSARSGKLAWSSNRSGSFDLWYADLTNVEGTATQITFGVYPERHPHLSHDGLWIIYTAKYRFEPSVICPKSECSIPVNEPCGWYEGLRIIQVGTWIIYDIDLSGMPIIGGGSWPLLNNNWVGHPSFAHDDSQILFSAALDEGGTNWETYVADFTPPNVVSNLRRVTQGTVYPITPNPIPMSAGAHFSHSGMDIYYGSTRTPLGNSQIFKIPAASINAPVHPLNQVTWNNGNDYVPEPLMDGRVVITSDLGFPSMGCMPADTGVTMDLDLYLVNDDGSSRINLTDNDATNEMYLIGDEVSWFCGLKPNLSECTFMLKTWNICWFREFFKLANYPTYLPTFPKKSLYERAWPMVQSYMNNKDPLYWNMLMQDMFQNESNCQFNGWMEVQSWWLVPSFFNEMWDNELPRPPALIAPYNKTHSGVSNINFDWTDLPEATSYGISVSTDPSFTNEIISMSLLGVSHFAAPLPDGIYYWRASATNLIGETKSLGTTWSTVWMLEVDTTTPIPTLSQWGLIIFTLLIVSFGMVFLYKRQSLLALSGVSNMADLQPKFFHRQLYFKVLAIVLLLGICILAIAYLLLGSIDPADPVGVVVSSFIVAYMVQLVILMRRE